jgi:hypothetical protein
LQETATTGDRSTCNSEDPIPLREQNNQSNPVVTSTSDSRDPRNGTVTLGCTTANAHSSPGRVEGVGHPIGLVSQISPAASGSHAPQTGPSYQESSTRGDENWETHETFSLADDASVNVGRPPNLAQSPSVSSGYHVEDGIFEHGSAYQNLFQSLRSQVFRTAQFELEPLDAGLRLRSGISPGYGGTNNFPATDGGGEIYAYKPAADFQTFELPLTQEYLLWKAWTEEVSIWVCPQKSKRVTLD